MPEQIRLDRDGPIATLTLARPATRNAMTPQMGREVRDAVAELAASDVRAVIVTGEGSAFSAGGDFAMLTERAGGDPEQNRRAMERFYRLYLSLRELPMPTIAAINGHAIGAGGCVTLACDLRVMATGAKIGFTFARVGLHPGMGATYLLPRLVGPAAASELLLSARVLDADEALRIGLVNQVADDALAAARVIAERIAACAPLAVAKTVASLRHAAPTLDDALRREASAQALDYGTTDLAQGIEAARARRQPVFRGR